MKTVAILVDDLALGSPAQQIADRFLIGFARDGVFEKPPFEKVLISTDTTDKIAGQRKRDFPANFATSRGETIAKADAIICFQSRAISDVIEKARKSIPVFIYGSVSRDVLKKAEEKNILVCAGTEFSTLQQLPPMEIPTTAGIGAQIREALIVTQGSAPQAELDAFEALAPILERNGGLPEIKRLRTLEGDAVWDAGGRDWSWKMLAAALSRTDKAQGNTALDGRTEDIVGLGLTQKMAKNPRAQIIEHAGGLRTAILVLDGVVADLLVAVRAGRRLLPGTIYSTQVFQSPAPQQEQFSRLAAVITDFFQSGKEPWDTNRAAIAADLAERLRK